MESLSWPLSRSLLEAVLADRLSDRLVAELVWERLGYRQQSGGGGLWLAGPQTPEAWRDAFPEAPEVVATRPASVALTRSIPREHKQLLLEQLFVGLGDRARQAHRGGAQGNHLRAEREDLCPVRRCPHAGPPASLAGVVTESLPDPLTDEAVTAAVLEHLMQQRTAQGPERGNIDRQHGPMVASSPLQLPGRGTPRELTCRVLQSPWRE